VELPDKVAHLPATLGMQHQVHTFVALMVLLWEAHVSPKAAALG
jgi:hypothetical protein